MKKIDLDSPLPKYYQVYQILREQIEDQTYKVGMTIPSERMLVSDFSVSRITIVKAIDLLVQEHLVGRKQGVGNFVINPSEQQKEEKNWVISLILPETSHTYTMQLVYGAVRAAAECDSILNIVNYKQRDGVSELLSSLQQHGTNGVIILGKSSKVNSFFSNGKWNQEMPMVLIDRYWSKTNQDYVVFDDYQAAYDLTEMLVNHGCQRIAFIPGNEFLISSVQNRLKGYKEALIDKEILVEDELVFFDYLLPIKGETNTYAQLTTHYLKEFITKHKPDAFVAVNSIVFELLSHDLLVLKNQCLRELVYRSDVLEDNSVDPTCCEVALTAISDQWKDIQRGNLLAIAFQDGAELGGVAVRLMHERLRNPAGPAQHIEIPMTIFQF